jgi:arylsulfatase A-like enzyme
MKLNRRDFIKAMGLGVTSMAVPGCVNATGLSMGGPIAERPNFIIIFTDDQGYADVGCFGAKGFETPNLDRMGAEGVRFTEFYVAAPSCTPSRAALLTGCYPQRVSLPRVLFPYDKIGLNPKEVTIADILKARGYATACVGKWHLGHLPAFLPRRQGFDYYFGLPYSNDMRPENDERDPPIPLIEGETPIELNSDQSQLTRRYTEKSVEFIAKNRDRPFFLYLPHTMPHVPLFVSDRFKGKSKQGLYGDVIMEIDWSVGQILSTLERLGIDEKTLVIFTSDNGPWLAYGDYGGSAGPLREGKGTTWEGGMREPCIMRWPGKIPAGAVCDEMASTIDILPTLARLCGARLPRRRIDGKDIWSLMSGEPGAKTPHEAYYFYRHNELQAVRSGKWKLHFPHSFRSMIGEPGSGGKAAGYGRRKTELALYDLKSDIGEKHNVAAEHPKVVERLIKLADKMREDIGDSRKRMKGKNRRPPGRM